MPKSRHRRKGGRATPRHPRPGWSPHGDWHGVIVGWAATVADLEDAKRQTHDAVIEMLGPARRGGVTWRISSGDQANAVLHDFLEDATPEQANHYRRVRGMLREYGGYVVVASAPGVRA